MKHGFVLSSLPESTHCMEIYPKRICFNWKESLLHEFYFFVIWFLEVYWPVKNSPCFNDFLDIIVSIVPLRTDLEFSVRKGCISYKLSFGDTSKASFVADMESYLKNSQRRQGGKTILRMSFRFIMLSWD